jgi:O-succinylbenzoic acid--CoA ligase
MTMFETIEQVHNAADQLMQYGVKAGDRVACLSHNSPGATVVVLACWQLGATVVPLSTRFSKVMFQEAISAMQCKLAVVSAPFRELVSDIDVLPLEGIHSLETDTFGSIHFDQLGLDPDQEASIILTSGSSGRAKGVLHTVGNHLYSARGSEQTIPFGAHDTWLMSLPLYHISGFSLIMRALLHGGTLRFMGSEQTLEQGLSSNTTHISLVPTQLKCLLSNESLDKPLQRLKAMLVGGAACPPSWVKTARAREWPIYLTYGSTEAASQVTTAHADELALYPGASGRVLPHREMRIAPDGEILLRGKTLLKAYIHAGGRQECPFDGAGWFHSGDTGRLDPTGKLYLTGRKDLMFVSGGENIFPEEIEHVLLEIDGVECCTVVSVPHAEFGRRPAAFIKSSEPQGVQPEQIERALSALERFKRPDHIYDWPAHLPVSLKPDRAALEKHALGLTQA